MERLEDQERLTALRRVGLTERAIGRLRRLRRNYTTNLLDLVAR